MPLKREATELLNNRFWQLIKQEIEAEYFEEWQQAATVFEREDLHVKCSALLDLVDRIENEADRYDPPKMAEA